MERNQDKKRSIFSGIMPGLSEPPAQPERPAEPAPRPAPAPDAERINALSRKIDLMESNIVGELGKKLAQQAPPPPPPPSPLAPAMLAKMTEMENRLKEFQEKFVMGTAQMKNIEESKIGARREIEELLKAVREQQKYTELDRQMHDQLEKAWSRVEEMEKRLMEVYASAAKKEEGPRAPNLTAEEVAAGAARAVEAALAGRLKALEAAVVSLSARAEAAPAPTGWIEAGAREAVAGIDARLKEFGEELRQQRLDAFSGKQAVEERVLETRQEILSAVPEGVEKGSAAFVRHLDASALDARERLDSLARTLVCHMDEISEAQRRGEERGAALEKRVSEMLADAEKGMGKRAAELVEALRAENAGQLASIKEALHLSAAGSAAMAASVSAVSRLELRLAEVMKGLKTMVRSLEAVNLDGLMGVSGSIVRKNFEAASGLIGALEREAVSVAGVRAEIEINLKSVRLNPGD
ncbi:MAG: hypothetical protein A2X31_06950 [Elusimicrobia bacterium GWB2_63_22]|nr:MAG: hypothetical protein A2X31_06950 [Elusimicrobia bacterium GWB2_63_22]